MQAKNPLTVPDHDYGTPNIDTSSPPTANSQLVVDDTQSISHGAQTDDLLANKKNDLQMIVNEFDANLSTQTNTHDAQAEEQFARNVSYLRMVVDKFDAIAASSKRSVNDTNKYMPLIKKIHANTSTTVVSTSTATPAPSQDHQVVECLQQVVISMLDNHCSTMCWIIE